MVTVTVLTVNLGVGSKVKPLLGIGDTVSSILAEARLAGRRPLEAG
jgi:hypothetical protein